MDRLVRRGRLVLFFGLAAGAVYLLRDVAQLVLVAMLIAYVLNPFVSRLEVNTSRNAATAIVFLSLALAIGLGATVLFPVVQEQVAALQVGMDTDAVQRLLDSLDRWMASVYSSVGAEATPLSDRIRANVQATGDAMVASAPGLVSLITNVVIVPFLAVFLLRDGPQIKRSLIRLVPNRYFEFSLDAIHKMDQQLGKYLRGLVLDTCAVIVLATTALWLLGIDSYVLLGVLTGLANVIPYVGAILAGTLAALLTLVTSGSPSLAAAVVGTILAVQVVDETLIQPLVLAQTVDLHPIEVVLAIAVAGQFFGILGMILAVPVTSAAKVVVSEGLALIQQYRFD